MLKTEDFIRSIPINTKTDRDVDVFTLMEWIQKVAQNYGGKIPSLLDVGAHWSHAYYASKIRPYIQRYDAIDILEDQNTADIVDNYYVGNAINYAYPQKYDVVICVSTIEHAGVSTYKGEPAQEQHLLFRECFKQANKYVFLSFPIGQKYLYEGELSVIHKEIFDNWTNFITALGAKYKTRFFYNQSVTEGYPWREHAKEDVALAIPYLDMLGTQSIGILEIEK